MQAGGVNASWSWTARARKAEQGEWEVYGLPTTQSAFPQLMSSVMGKAKPLGVHIIQTMGSLLSAILEQTDDLKKSANRVLHLWLSHYQQFGSFVTKMSDSYRDTLQIRDPKLI